MVERGDDRGRVMAVIFFFLIRQEARHLFSPQFDIVDTKSQQPHFPFY